MNQPISCFQYMLRLHEVCQFQTIEGSRVGVASKSELRRWFNDKAVRINYELVKATDELPPWVVDLVLFPKNNRKRTTLIAEPVTFIKINEEPQRA